MAYIIHICNHGRQNMYLDLYEGTKTLFSMFKCRVDMDI